MDLFTLEEALALPKEALTLSPFIKENIITPSQLIVLDYKLKEISLNRDVGTPSCQVGPSLSSPSSSLLSLCDLRSWGKVGSVELGSVQLERSKGIEGSDNLFNSLSSPSISTEKVEDDLSIDNKINKGKMREEPIPQSWFYLFSKSASKSETRVLNLQPFG